MFPGERKTVANNPRRERRRILISLATTAALAAGLLAAGVAPALAAMQGAANSGGQISEQVWGSSTAFVFSGANSSYTTGDTVIDWAGYNGC
jgi:uncharacterized membrane protein